jgi:hypothetical protein
MEATFSRVMVPGTLTTVCVVVVVALGDQVMMGRFAEEMSSDMGEVLAVLVARRLVATGF